MFQYLSCLLWYSLKGCDYRHSYINQLWTFDGQQIRQGNLCLDVKGGLNIDGVKPQLWTCYDGNANQEFEHAGGSVLSFPRDRVSWAKLATNKCMDLTGGVDEYGTEARRALLECPHSNCANRLYIDPALDMPL